MAGTSQRVQRTAGDNTDVQELREQFNAAVDLLDTLMTGTVLLTDPGLAIGTSANTAVKHNEIVAMFNGHRIRIAAGEVAFTATTHDIADPDANPREAIYVISTAVAGTVTITKGDTAAGDAAVAPSTPANHIKLGEVKVRHDGTAIFDASSDALNAAHLTVTYTDAAHTTNTVCKVLDQNTGS
jgi:hypothetical protein